MTAANPPARKNVTAASERDEGGRVIPFPPGGQEGLRPGTGRWTFTTDVRWVGGAEGEWLRRELGGVVRDLLAWARDDMAAEEFHGGEEKRAA